MYKESQNKPHVCADLYRALAHACAWEVSRVTSKFKSRTVYWLILVFLVHVCADLYRVLAHACAWEVRTGTSKFKSRILYSLILAFLVYVCADLYRE